MDVLLSLLSRLLNALVTAKDPITVILAIVAIVYAAIQKHESSLLLRSSSELKGKPMNWNGTRKRMLKKCRFSVERWKA